jgi:hypothetical protein
MHRVGMHLPHTPWDPRVDGATDVFLSAPGVITLVRHAKDIYHWPIRKNIKNGREFSGRPVKNYRSKIALGAFFRPGPLWIWWKI